MSIRHLPQFCWPRLPDVVRLVGTTAAVLVLGILGAATLSAATPAPAAANPRPARSTSSEARSRTVVDHAVQPAGGACRDCGPGGCHRQHAPCHHRNCREGACVPYCPVRPGTFGYYGTQWRRWPGQGVVPVSNQEAATPAVPPKSEVPDADEESMAPEPSELPEPDMPAARAADLDRGGSPLDRPFPPEPDTTPAAAEPDAGREPVEPTQPAPREVPRADEARPAQPEAAPAKTRPEDENLFDDSAARKIRRKIPIANVGQPSQRETGKQVQPANHELEAIDGEREPVAAAPLTATGRETRPARPRTVPRVAFDPRAETARMRQAR